MAFKNTASDLNSHGQFKLRGASGGFHQIVLMEIITLSFLVSRIMLEIKKKPGKNVPFHFTGYPRQ